jgi:hypothetical protein
MSVMGIFNKWRTYAFDKLSVVFRIWSNWWNYCNRDGLEVLQLELHFHTNFAVDG